MSSNGKALNGWLPCVRQQGPSGPRAAGCRSEEQLPFHSCFAVPPGGHLIDVSAELKDRQQERVGCRRICSQGIHQTLEGDQDLHTREQPSAARGSCYYTLSCLPQIAGEACPYTLGSEMCQSASPQGGALPPEQAQVAQQQHECLLLKWRPDVNSHWLKQQQGTSP